MIEEGNKLKVRTGCTKATTITKTIITTNTTTTTTTTTTITATTLTVQVSRGKQFCGVKANFAPGGSHKSVGYDHLAAF